VYRFELQQMVRTQPKEAASKWKRQRKYYGEKYAYFLFLQMSLTYTKKDNPFSFPLAREQKTRQGLPVILIHQ